MNEIVLTNYNTVKFFDEYNREFGKEVMLNELFNNIEYYLNCYYINYHNTQDITYLYMDTYVKKVGEDAYEIGYGKTYLLKNSKSNKNYVINKEILDNFCKISERKENNNNIIASFEKGKKSYNLNDLYIYNDYLQNRKKQINMDIFKYSSHYFYHYLSVGSVPATIAICFGTGHPVASLLSAFSIIPIILTGCHISEEDSREYLRECKKYKEIVDEKIEIVKKQIELAKEYGNNYVEKEQPIENKDTYEDTIYSFMNSIIQKATVLDIDSKKEITIELRDIFEEYTANIIEYNKIDSKNYNNKVAIYTKTIDKIVDLEDKLGVLLSKTKKNEVIISESERLREQINLQIEESSGPVKTLRQTKGTY